MIFFKKNIRKNIHKIAFWGERKEYIDNFCQKKTVLHLGPGKDNKKSFSIDINPYLKPTVVGNIEKKLPFKNDSFDGIIAFSVIEHIGQFFQLMEEIHRVLKPNGIVFILTPHFSDDASFVDPSHVLHLSARSFDYFIPNSSSIYNDYSFYSNIRFNTQIRLLMLKFPWNRVPFLQSFCNRFIGLYEKHLCYIIRAGGLYFELIAQKSPLKSS